MATTEIVYASKPETDHSESSRFYRPELDALRFLAFLAVYICHSIPNTLASNVPGVGGRFIHVLTGVKDMGNFGVCLFFLLSAFLITELLCREFQQFKTIHIKAFYLRRILRIWPLYFGITIVYALGGLLFPALRMEPGRILAYFLFAGNWYLMLRPWLQTPLRALWSISVEEQFYLIWPWLMKWSGRCQLIVIALITSLTSLIFVYIISKNRPYAYVTVWVSSLSQLQYFSWGALLALAARGRTPKMKSIERAVMILGGIALWWVAAAVIGIKRPGKHILPYQFCLGYAFVACGCILLFIALLGISSRRVPVWIAYLGKVSCRCARCG
jgi:peptidoglycan/LPS O-acetylase OafA/YrhL